MLDRLVELIEGKKIFRRRRKDALAVLIYHAGLSYRKTSAILKAIEPFSHEALRKWYTKCESIFYAEKRKRRAIAIDETKVRWEESIYLSVMR
jgi:transposase-like protein